MPKNDRERPEPRAEDLHPYTICGKQGTLYLRVQDFDAIVSILYIAQLRARFGDIDNMFNINIYRHVRYVIMLDNVVNKC